jgi:cytochrome oxidase Cu insertion factor (SCO1/SenC/PrrC family)
MNDASQRQRRNNRLVLLAILALFLGGLIVAGALRFSGWQPAGTKNNGELLQPPGDLRAVVPRLADGSAYRWNPDARLWRIVVAPPVGCSDACVALSRELDTVWRLFGKDADRVHVLWLGEPPAGAVRNAATRVVVPSAQLRAGLPRPDSAPGEAARAGAPVVYVVDPNGFVVLRYAPGFDPAGLRADLAKLLKLM